MVGHVAGPAQRAITDARADGYALAALLVAINILAVLLSVALPAWQTLAQREREAELAFRGEQYARAIALYQQAFGNASPPSLDILVEQRFLRRLYSDPMAADGEFEPIIAWAGEDADDPTTGPAGIGIIGVRSRSQETSLREYNGATRYDQWLFLGVNMSRTVGFDPGAAGGAGAPNDGSATDRSEAIDRLQEFMQDQER